MNPAPAPPLSAVALIRLENAATDNGFDCALPRQDQWLAFASSQPGFRSG